MSQHDERVRRAWSDDEIEDIARRSTEFPEITDADLAAALAVGRGGRRKVPISIRLDEETLERIRAMGGRYQTRINDLLAAYAAGRVVRVPEELAAQFDGQNLEEEVARLVSEHLLARAARSAFAPAARARMVPSVRRGRWSTDEERQSRDAT
jgi:uncharacterized protein (DUF4415 family)